jgi:hypothetical protein
LLLKPYHPVVKKPKKHQEPLAEIPVDTPPVFRLLIRKTLIAMKEHFPKLVAVMGGKQYLSSPSFQKNQS